MSKVTNYGYGLIANAVLSEILAVACKAEAGQPAEINLEDLASRLDIPRAELNRTCAFLEGKGKLTRTNLMDWEDISTMLLDVPSVSAETLQTMLALEPEKAEGLDRLFNEPMVDVDVTNSDGEDVTMRVAIVPENPQVPKGACLMTITQVVDGQPVDDHRMIMDRVRFDTIYAAVDEAKRITGLGEDEDDAESEEEATG